MRIVVPEHDAHHVQGLQGRPTPHSTTNAGSDRHHCQIRALGLLGYMKVRQKGGGIMVQPFLNVECCNMSLVWLPTGRSGKALIQ